jgi:glycosyltransferase involved in cell wall biosynthesis
VLVLSHLYWPHVGGAESVAKWLCGALTERGCRFSVVTRNYTGALPREEVVDGIPVRRFGTSRLRRWSKIQFMVQAIRHCIRHREGYDVLHAHIQQYDLDVLAAYGAWLATRKPYVLHVHRSDTIPWLLKLRDHSPLKAFGPNRFPKRLFVAAFRRAHAVLVVDRPTEELVSRHGLGRCRYVPNSTRVRPGATDLELRAALRRTLGVPEGAFAVVAVGVLRPEKNFMVLLQAWRALSASDAGRPMRLIILGGAYEGSPETAQELRAYAEAHRLDSVVFAGAVANVEEYLRASDVFVHPSLVEGASLAIIEAMSAELPVVVSDIPGNRDLVPSEAVGLSFDPSDPRALAAQVERLLRDDGLRRTLGRRARARAEEAFSAERALAEVATVYAEVSAPRHPAA